MVIIPDIHLAGQRIIAATGAGGKSSFLQCLARQLKADNQRVLVTTTTHIYHPGHSGFISHVDQMLSPDALFSPAEPGTITVSGSRSNQPEKLSGIEPQVPGQLIAADLYDYVLVEADGAREKPLKAPASHEPVLPDQCDLVIGVTGWRGISQPASPDSIHRWQEFSTITGLADQQKITAEAICRLLDSPLGLFKRTPETAGKLWLINQLDNPGQQSEARRFAMEVIRLSQQINTALLGNLGHSDPQCLAAITGP